MTIQEGESLFIHWEKFTDEVIWLYRQGRYGRAVAVARKALQIAEQAVNLNRPGVVMRLE